MGEPRIAGRRVDVAPDVEFGPDVEIDADEVVIGSGARIGISGDEDFRTAPGVRIRAERVLIGPGASIGRSVRIEGGTIELDADVRIMRNATVRVLDHLHIGEHGTVGEGGEISGRSVSIGQELWMLPQAKIGGGSALEVQSRLEMGHYVHVGVHALINTARPVRIGHEVGLGTRTSIYTHGAYPSRLMGFPVAFDDVSIGDFSWVPGATINPGVHIGRNCVIGVNSLVTSSIPDGALAAGSPARVLKENAYPKPMTPDARIAFFTEFLDSFGTNLGSAARVVDGDHGAVRLDTGELLIVAAATADALTGLTDDRRSLVIADDATSIANAAMTTAYDTASRRIVGVADAASDRLANELRRYGIRFYSRPARDGGGTYVDWEPTPPAFAPA